MAEPVLFDPAIEVLLREIAADPDSCLLRVPRPNIVKSLAHRQGVVRSGATGLSTVERELLRVYRAELAKLLREACVMRLYAHPQARLELSLHLTATRKTKVMPAPDWRASAHHALAAARGRAESLSGLDLLDACVAPGGLESATVAQLAVASMRLEPTDAARIYPAIELTLDGQEETAIRVLHDVLAGFCARACAPYAWGQIALVHSKQGKTEAARVAYLAAIKIDRTYVPALVSVLGEACTAEDLERITTAEAALDEQLGSAQEALIDYRNMLRDRCASKRLTVSRDRIAQLRKLRDQVGRTARMVLDALL